MGVQGANRWWVIGLLRATGSGQAGRAHHEYGTDSTGTGLEWWEASIPMPAEAPLCSLSPSIFLKALKAHNWKCQNMDVGMGIGMSMGVA